MHGEKAPSHADMQLLLKPGMHHLVMITTQECERTADKSILNPSKAAWEAALNVAFGDHYVLVRSHGLAAIHISLLCHRALVPLISHIDSAAVATGLGSRTKDKKIKQQDDFKQQFKDEVYEVLNNHLNDYKKLKKGIKRLHRIYVLEEANKNEIGETDLHEEQTEMRKSMEKNIEHMRLNLRKGK